MSERIQTLEEALASLQASVSKDPHPLLQQHLLRVKSSAELHRAQGADAKSSSGTSDDPLESEISRGGMPNLFDYSMAEQSYFAPKDPQHVSGIIQRHPVGHSRPLIHRQTNHTEMIMVPHIRPCPPKCSP